MKAEAVSGPALAAAIGRHLAEQHVVADVFDVRPLSGGACQDLFLVELGRDGARERWVLRSDARTGLPGSISRRREFAVVRAAVEAGVPTPDARWYADDLVRPGAGAYFLEWRDGVALGGKIVREPGLAAAREALPGQLADAIARVHRVSPGSGLDLAGPASSETPAARGLSVLRATLDRLPDPRPDLELAVRWLRRHAPADPTVTLVHGDFRTGNFLVGPAGLTAVLDWEFAHFGSPWEDVGWLCVRDWRFGALRSPVGGFSDRATFYAAYARAAGRPVDVEAVHWWEVFGNVSWAAGALWQTQRFLDGETDLELLAIGRRASEMAWEALRLVELGVVT